MEVIDALEKIIQMTNDMPNLRQLILEERVLSNYVTFDGREGKGEYLVVDYNAVGMTSFSIEGTNYIVNVFRDMLNRIDDYKLTHSHYDRILDKYHPYIPLSN